MVPPLLKLVFIKGPREGETLEYNPGSTVRVGRIVRGNNLAIKDAGISTKHFRIESDSGKWVIFDLGSSNGTLLNSTFLPVDTPFDLCHGDTIKLGESTSIEVNLVVDVKGNDAVQMHKLPPRPRRNNRGRAVVESDPVESLQEKSTRTTRSTKQGNERSKENEDEHELPRRGKVSRSRISEDVAEELEVAKEKDEKKVNSRVSRARKNTGSENSSLDDKKAELAESEKEDVVKEEKKGNSRVRRNRNTESTQSSCLNSGKLETEDTTKGLENSEVEDEKGVNRRGTRSKKIESTQNSCSELKNGENEVETAVGVLEKKVRSRVNSRATRSKSNQIFGDSYLELDIIESQARKRRGRRKKVEEKPLESIPLKEAEDTDVAEEVSTVEEHIENEQDTSLPEEHHNSNDRETQDCSEVAKDRYEEEGAEDSIGKSVERVQVVLKKTSLGEDAENYIVGEEEEGLQDLGLNGEYSDAINEDRDYRTVGDGCEASNDTEKHTRMSQTTSVNHVDVDLGKMTLGEWFVFMEAHLPKQIIDETENMIGPMRSKSRRVHEYIVEQKKVKGKGLEG